MIKVALLQFLILTGLIAAASTEGVPTAISWMDIGIIEQIRIVAGLLFMILIGIAGVVVFSSVWVKGGYAGADKILVDKEVSLFISHVLAFFLVEVFIFMILFYNYVKPPAYAFYICSAGFLSPEAVRVIHFVLDRFKFKKKTE